jgi:DNA-binding NarL/FixJ family response regulator
MKKQLPIKILIADDHRMVRVGIRAMLSATTATIRLEIDEAETTEEAIRSASAISYDVILMDIHLPGIGGPKAAEIILSRGSTARILGLSSYDERSHVDRMMAAGARGYILKDIEPDTLVTAIKTVLGGKVFYSNAIALKLLEPLAARQAATEEKRLSAREKEVFRHILTGLTDREIAGHMGISKRTVDKHRQNLKAKLGARNAVELAQAGVKMGMI